MQEATIELEDIATRLDRHEAILKEISAAIADLARREQVMYIDEDLDDDLDDDDE